MAIFLSEESMYSSIVNFLLRISTESAYLVMRNGVYMWKITNQYTKKNISILHWMAGVGLGAKMGLINWYWWGNNSEYFEFDFKF